MSAFQVGVYLSAMVIFEMIFLSECLLTPPQLSHVVNSSPEVVGKFSCVAGAFAMPI